MSKAANFASDAGKIIGLAVAIGGGALWFTNNLQLAIISGVLTIAFVWLKVLTDDMGRVKKKVGVRD